MSSMAGLSYGVFSSSGVALPLSASSAMQCSLPLLKKNNKFSQTLFWGKVAGKMGEYFIAMGIEESMNAPKFFFCQDGVSWGQLDTPSAEDFANCAKIAEGVRLSGDIAHQITLAAEPVPEGEEPAEEVPPTVVGEQTRLAVIVATINRECAMAPVGALATMASGSISNNPNYAGLGAADASSLASYVLINQANASCEAMVPKGALVAKLDEALNVVTFRSLSYPGFISYAAVGTPLWGYGYFGTGEKNADLAFMLP